MQGTSSLQGGEKQSYGITRKEITEVKKKSVTHLAYAF